MMKKDICSKSSPVLLKTGQLFSLRSSKEEITRDSELETLRAYSYQFKKLKDWEETYDSKIHLKILFFDICCKNSYITDNKILLRFLIIIVKSTKLYSWCKQD